MLAQRTKLTGRTDFDLGLNILNVFNQPNFVPLTQPTNCNCTAGAHRIGDAVQLVIRMCLQAHHSARSAMTGSTRVARRAGTTLATSAVTTRNAATVPNDTGSSGLTW